MVQVIHNPVVPTPQVSQQPGQQQRQVEARTGSGTGAVPRTNINNNNNSNNNGHNNIGYLLRKCRKEQNEINDIQNKNHKHFLPLSSDSITYLDVLKIFDKAVHEGNYHIGTECLHRLIAFVNVQNALKIFVTVFKLCAKPDSPQLAGDYLPSAPPLPRPEYEDEPEVQPKFYKPLSILYRTLMQIILDNGDSILQQKEVEDLSYEDAYFIMAHDNLIISKEKVVYLAVCRWFKASCTKQRISSASYNSRDVMGMLAYAPRYGMMSKKEFLARKIEKFPGPYKMECLAEDEAKSVLAHIKERENGVPARLLTYKMSKPRNYSKNDSEKPSASTSTETTEKKENVALLRCLACWSAVFD